MKNILTVDCAIPGGFGEQVAFFSKASLLDGDFVLFQPPILPDLAYESYQGKRLYPESSSFRIREAITHWRKELVEALTAGKTVVFLLSDVDQAFVYTGEQTTAGTGRNRQTTKTVEPVSNYDLFPFSTKFVESRGTAMSLVVGDSLIYEYWRQFGNDSSYRVYLTGSPQPTPLVRARSSDRVVGGIFYQKSGGALVALPWTDFYREEFFAEELEPYEDEARWTKEAKAWGKKFCNALESLDQSIRSRAGATLAPQWVQAEEFLTLKETALRNELKEVRSEIVKLSERQDVLVGEVRDAGFLKALLYEQGIPLEHAVLEAMRLMGFEASSYRDSDSEFDVVLECAEGRCVGEVEGRDNRAIDINKMRQLEVNIQEDFSRDEVSEPAKAVLFGNAHRLIPPPERPADQFTAKCVTAAERNGTALVRTSDLFGVATILSDHFDADFAKTCREAIFATKGTTVTFPHFPKTEWLALNEEPYQHGTST